MFAHPPTIEGPLSQRRFVIAYGRLDVGLKLRAR
jgi:hypothetical protein